MENENDMDDDLSLVIETLAGGASLIAEECAITGDVVLQGSAKVDGTVEGSITITNDQAILYISQNGKVKGEVRAAHVYIEGAVDGVVHAGTVTVAGVLNGDLYYTTALVVKNGAEIKGKIDKGVQEEQQADSTSGRVAGGNRQRPMILTQPKGANRQFQQVSPEVAAHAGAAT